MAEKYNSSGILDDRASNKSGDSLKQIAGDMAFRKAEELKLKKELYTEEKRLRKELHKADTEHQKEINELLAAAQKEREEQEKRFKEQQRKDDQETANKVAGVVQNAALSFKDNLSAVMDNFLQTQQSMAYNLSGATNFGTSGKDAFSNLNANLTKALQGTSLVRQEAVYNNLANLVNQGIIYNVEQRAFLQTISKDLGMIFDPMRGELPRLINLQRQDLSANRVAIEASLKEFLNQNYETSQYIHEGFQQVSDALVEAQSIMTANSAMQMEATLQTWLGSLSSVGASSGTIQSLAKAIGELGSGNISSLSNSSMQNLLVMGAARSGLSYAQLLTQGVGSDAVNALMEGIVTYMGEIGQNASNVVKSEYARIFGVNVSDLVAASQVGIPNISGVTTNVGEALLNNYGSDYLYFNKKIDNVLSNILYGTAVNTASDELLYSIYKITDIIGGTLGASLEGQSIGAFGVSLDVGKALQALPLLALVPGLMKSLDLGALIGNMTSGNAMSLFDALAGGEVSSQYIKSGGALMGFGRTSGLQSSGSMIIANTSTSDIAKTARNSSGNFVRDQVMEPDEEYYDTTDIYKLLSEVNDVLTQFPTTPFGTITRISEAANTVTIGNDLTYLQDMITMSAMNIQNIYLLLLAKFATGYESAAKDNLTDAGSFEWNNSFDWVVQTSKIKTSATTTNQ